MKTQRRHELQTNVLADWLGHQIEQIRPYSKTILGVVLAFAVLAVLATYLINDQAAKLSAGWSDFYAASFEQSSDRLRSVAVEYAGTEAALWALLGEADLEQAAGLRQLFTDRKSAKESLERAQDSYELVEQGAGDQRELLQAAWFGLGQVHESLSDLDTAQQYYKKVVADNTTALGREAQKRIELLDKPEVIRFYNWFANQEPQPQMPPGLPPGLDLPNLGELPERPDLPIPSVTTPSSTDEQQPSDPAPNEENESPPTSGEAEPAAKPEAAAEQPNPASGPSTAPSDPSEDSSQSAAAPSPSAEGGDVKP